MSPARLAVGLVSAALLAGAVVLAVQLIGGLQQSQRIEIDRAGLQDVQYGLFNAEVWVGHAATVLAAKIDGFELTEASRPQLKRNLELVLDRLFVEVDAYMRRRNASGDSFLDRLQGGLRQGVQDWLLNVNELRARVPFYADALIDELNRPEARADIKGALLDLLHRAADATFAAVDRTRFDAVLARYGCAAAADCVARLTTDAAALDAQNTRRALGVLGLVAALFLLHGVGPRLVGRPGSGAGERPGAPPTMAPETMVMLTAATLVLLAAGVLTPMIEVEARIDELRFAFFGETVVFRDQVLYFQSKSIIDVVRVLADTGKADMLLVAVLITLFSLIFPALKVLAGFLYYADPRGLRRHPVVAFFALRSAKWSMADVLVVAMLMAYVGFKGLVSSQLRSIAAGGRGLDLVTTDGTALQLGFYLFLAFVLASLVQSTLLEARRPG